MVNFDKPPAGNGTVARVPGLRGGRSVIHDMRITVEDVLRASVCAQPAPPA